MRTATKINDKETSMEDIHNLVGHFLKQQGYNATLAQLEKDYGRAIKPQPLPFTHETLVQIVNDKIQFDQLHDKMKAFELHKDDNIKHNQSLLNIIQDQMVNWSLPYPQVGRELATTSGLAISMAVNSNLNHIYIATNDRTLYDIDIKTGSVISETLKGVFKKIVVINNDELILVGMDGKLNRHDRHLKFIDSIQGHPRLVIDAKYVQFGGIHYLISLGWDNKVKIFKLDDSISLVDEVAISNTGASFDVTIYENKLVIVVAKNDITLLDVICFNASEKKLTLDYNISINDAEFTSIGFSPRFLCIQTCKDSIPLIAIATSHEPYMRLIIVSLNQFEEVKDTRILRNQIIKNINTMSPQHKLSQSVIQWRTSKHEKSQGVWVMGEEGTIRMIDIIDNEVVNSLDGHDGAIKHCLTYIDEGEEVLITTGIDKKVKLWKCS